jgi:AcrR family transcriptional regulator
MTRSAEATRQAFLEEGLALFTEAGVGRGLRTVPVAEVAKRLGRTTGAAYQIWERQEDYHHDLVTYILSTVDWTGPEILVNISNDAARGSLDDLLRESTQAYLDSSTAQRFSYLVNHFYALSIDDDGVRSALLAGAHRHRDRLLTLTNELLKLLARRMREPYTPIDLVTAGTALTEGFKLITMQNPDWNRRVQRVDRPPDAPSWTLYSVSFEAMFERFTEPISFTQPTSGPKPASGAEPASSEEPASGAEPNPETAANQSMGSV